jgi:hypothetical protein
MSGQPKLFPEPAPTDGGETSLPRTSTRPAVQPGPGGAPAGLSQPATRTAPIWLQRVSLFVLVLFCVYLGVLVMVLPWWTRIWDHNMFIQARPALAAVLHNGAVRGMISGLGIVDIWIGISEAVHYRDYRG